MGKAILTTAIAAGALIYANYLVGSNAEISTTVETAKNNIAAHNTALELAGVDTDLRQLGTLTASAAPDVPSIPTVPAKAAPGWKFPKFSSADSVPGNGTAIVKGTSRERCRELALKWAGSVTVNGQEAKDAAALCHGGDTVVHTL